MMAPPAWRLAFMMAARRVQVVLATLVRQISKLGSLVKSATLSLMLLTVKLAGEAAGTAASVGATPVALSARSTESANTTRPPARKPLIIGFCLSLDVA